MPKFRVFIKDMAAQDIVADSWEIDEEDALVLFYVDPSISSGKRNRSKNIALAVKLSDFQAVQLL